MTLSVLVVSLTTLFRCPREGSCSKPHKPTPPYMLETDSIKQQIYVCSGIPTELLGIKSQLTISKQNDVYYYIEIVFAHTR